MNSAEEYFNQVQQLIDHTPDAVIERYEEQLLSETRGVLRIRLRFPDDALLEKRKGSKKDSATLMCARVRAGVVLRP